jgi:hypothetical protein
MRTDGANRAFRQTKSRSIGANRAQRHKGTALVGRARFELAVSWSQTRRFTELSYRPPFEPPHSPREAGPR